MNKNFLIILRHNETCNILHLYFIWQQIDFCYFLPASFLLIEPFKVPPAVFPVLPSHSVPFRLLTNVWGLHVALALILFLLFTAEFTRVAGPQALPRKIV